MMNANTLDLSALLKQSPEPETVEPDESSHLVDPLDGRLINIEDVDSLIDAYEQAKEASTALYAWQNKLRETLGNKATGDAKSQRVRGRRRIVKVTKPSETWDQSILKEVYNSYPDKRDELLRVSTIGVKAREFKKATQTNGPDDFNNFVKMISSARRLPAGLPTINIEADIKD